MQNVPLDVDEQRSSLGPVESWADNVRGVRGTVPRGSVGNSQQRAWRDNVRTLTLCGGASTSCTPDVSASHRLIPSTREFS